MVSKLGGATEVFGSHEALEELSVHGTMSRNYPPASACLLRFRRSNWAPLHQFTLRTGRSLRIMHKHFTPEVGSAPGNATWDPVTRQLQIKNTTSGQYGHEAHYNMRYIVS